MFGFLKINPWLLAGAVAVGLGFGAVGGAQTYKLLVVPTLIKSATEIANAQCLAVTSEAARIAGNAERNRRAAALDEVQQNYRRTLAGIVVTRAVNQQRLQQEITDYERELAENGRSCPLDRRDIEWLLN